MKILIKNADIFQSGKLLQRDVLIEDGKIVKIETDLDLNVDRVIEAKGKTILPGLVDVHVHFRDPGQTQKETIETGSEA